MDLTGATAWGHGGEEGRQVAELERREARDAHLGGRVARRRGRPRQYATSAVAGWIQNTVTGLIAFYFSI
jgi:hypothetical protein